MILSTYIECLGKMEKYEAIPDYDKMTSWITNELSKKQFASIFEDLNMRYANLYGNAGIMRNRTELPKKASELR